MAYIDLRQQRRDTVDKGFTTDKTDLGMGLGLGRQMLASAKPNLKPNLARRTRRFAT